MRSVAFNHPETKIESEVTDSYGMFAETDGYTKALDMKSRSEFCSKALEFYLAYLHNKNTDYLGKVVTQTVESCVELQADRIADMLFKMAVSIEKQNFMLHYPNYDEEYIEEIAIENVQKRHGRLM